jgi:hypothetical protein
MHRNSFFFSPRPLGDDLPLPTAIQPPHPAGLRLKYTPELAQVANRKPLINKALQVFSLNQCRLLANALRQNQ